MVCLWFGLMPFITFLTLELELLTSVHKIYLRFHKMTFFYQSIVTKRVSGTVLINVYVKSHFHFCILI